MYVRTERQSMITFFFFIARSPSVRLDLVGFAGIVGQRTRRKWVQVTGAQTIVGCNSFNFSSTFSYLEVGLSESFVRTPHFPTSRLLTRYYLLQPSKKSKLRSS